MRDIAADMRAAMIQEYEGYARAGRDADAEHVAKTLKAEYGHDVVKKGDGGEDAKAASAPERADVEKPPEAAVDPKPRRTSRAKPGQGDSK